jgi:hypothetical protein
VSERPTELELALDAIDEVFKAEVAQFTKDKGEWEGKPQAGIPDPDKFVADGLNRARRARLAMIAMVKANSKS